MPDLTFLKEGEVIGASNCFCSQRIVARPFKAVVTCPSCGQNVALHTWTVPVNMAVTAKMALVPTA